MFNRNADNIDYVQRNFYTMIDPTNVTADEFKSALVRLFLMYDKETLSRIFKVEPYESSEFNDTLSWGIDIIMRYTVEDMFNLIRDYETSVEITPGDFAYFKDDDGGKHRGMVITAPYVIDKKKGTRGVNIFDGREVFNGVDTKKIYTITGHSSDFDTWLKGENKPI